MCGICGVIDIDSPLVKREEIVNRMSGHMKYRGPDHTGISSDANATFGHVRLSIVDLSENANQPMESSNKRYILSFNGEIYNYKEIRQQLINLGVVFKGNGDSEVLINAWACWGSEISGKLNGIFAFSIWDKKTKNLFLVRDRFGVKPLFYYYNDRQVVFCSEIGPLIKTDIIKKSISYKALHQYAYFGAPNSGETLFDQIKQVKPAEIITFKKGGRFKERYWHIENTLATNDSLQTISNNIRSYVETAVQRQLVGDVPIGVLLSGGVDSSIITAYTAKHYPGMVNTYTAGFDFEKGVNELSVARATSRHFNTNHHELIISGGELPYIIEDLIDHHGTPFADAANIPLYLISKELKGSPKVILQGDGGDELFGGYRSYRLLKNHFFWRFLSKFRYLIKSHSSSESINRLSRIFEIFSHDEKYKMMAYLSTTDTRNISMYNLFSDNTKELLNATDPFAYFKEQYNRLKGRDLVQKMMYIDTTIQLPNIFLEKVDRATMAFGIESRIPFLDNDLSQYAFSIPSNLKVRNKSGKWVLKQAMKGVIPCSVLNAKKTGFGVPYSYWISTSLYDYAHDIFATEDYNANGIFSKKRLYKMLLDHKKSPSAQTGYILWKALNFAVWRNKLNEW